MRLMTRPSETVNIIEAGEHGAESFGPPFQRGSFPLKSVEFDRREKERERAQIFTYRLKYHDDASRSMHRSRCITLYFYQKTQWNIDFYR